MATSPIPAPTTEWPKEPMESLAHWMSLGGDERILLDRKTGLNRYNTAPKPQLCAAYSSSTANFISAPAMAELERRLRSLPPGFQFSHATYAFGLVELRARLRAAWQLPPTVSIVFAASGTDLEYVGLATANRRSSAGIDNILLGAGEVGSGCPQAASGQHFAHQTPLGRVVEPGALIEDSLARCIRLVDIPIRADDGGPLPSADILLHIAEECAASIRARRRPLVHVVHGSKTGIIVPSLAHIDALLRQFGDQISFVVDACQARISREAIKAYLERGCTVFLTGSKFMGGPPFSGIALVPESVAASSVGMLPGFGKIFARGEWPKAWPGHEKLPSHPNFGLLLRLEASVFELERYNRLSSADIERTVTLFEHAADLLAKRIGAARLNPQSDGQALPIEMRTLATLDLSASHPERDYSFARRIYESAAIAELDSTVTNLIPVRIGQPTKSIGFSDGRFRANLRLSLSMPQIVKFSGMSEEALKRQLHDDFGYIGNRIETAIRAMMA